MRVRLIVLCFITLVGFINTAPGQSPNGTVSGIVLDPSGGVIAGADVLIINDATAVQYPGKTNGEGYYVVPNIPAGTYRIQVSNSGFKTIIKPDIVIHVEDALAINFTLPIGAASEIVTVEGGAPLINTQDATVSTVIDRNFVEALPLNGRSFNTLLQLTPGVVIGPASYNSPGQFNIAGQRGDANSFTVDGVSANFGAQAGLGLGNMGTGATPAFSAVGGTSSLVSVDALQEFRIETSSFAPEFGRQPGGQVILTTRSGTNDFHGGIFDYFRNTALDGNDWFANNVGNPRAAEHHNDFGGFLGGPIWKGKTFFFVSYEGARLLQPQTEQINVPSETARSGAPAALAPFMNAYPKPNGAVSADGYTALFTGTWSNQATLNATSMRIDHTFSDRFSLFGRFNYAPSQTIDRTEGLSTVETTPFNTETMTIGANMFFKDQISNTLRGNYSTQSANAISSLDSFGGAVPLSPNLILGSLAPENNLASFTLLDANDLSIGPTSKNRTRQFALVDDLAITKGVHQLKFGVDYRAIFLDFVPAQNEIALQSSTTSQFLSSQTAQQLTASSSKSSRILSQALSLYGQDTWKINSRLTLTYGLRRELVPAPTGLGSTTLASWSNVDNPAEISLAPSGKALWNTTCGNFAPRVGAAYALNERADFVFRTGVGIFYDLGTGESASLATFFPNSAYSFFTNVPVPITDVTQYRPTFSTQPPYSSVYIVGFAPNLKLPRSYQWNVGLEKSFEGHQVLSATYVGQAGRDLLREGLIYQPNANFSGDFLPTTNAAFSNYNALQLKYQMTLSSRLHALLSYTWSHSLDNSSNDTTPGSSPTFLPAPGDYGSSDFDVRHSLSGAVVFALPAAAKAGPFAFLTRDWSVDAVVVARTGLPFNANVYASTPDLLYDYPVRPDRVGRQPLWVSSPSAPGGKILNINAFSISTTIGQGNEQRNDIPGFGLTQVDLSVERKFPVTEGLNLQLRGDAFNLFNHPNFANPGGYIEFGILGLRSASMLNQGLGGLNPLFQEGGPRSLQISLKLTF